MMEGRFLPVTEIKVRLPSFRDDGTIVFGEPVRMGQEMTSSIYVCNQAFPSLIRPGKQAGSASNKQESDDEEDHHASLLKDYLEALLEAVAKKAGLAEKPGTFLKVKMPPSKNSFSSPFNRDNFQLNLVVAKVQDLSQEVAAISQPIPVAVPDEILDVSPLNRSESTVGILAKMRTNDSVLAETIFAKTGTKFCVQKALLDSEFSGSEDDCSQFLNSVVEEEFGRLLLANEKKIEKTREEDDKSDQNILVTVQLPPLSDFTKHTIPADTIWVEADQLVVELQCSVQKEGESDTTTMELIRKFPLRRSK